MKSYSEASVFRPDELAVLERAARMVARVVEPAGAVFRCHELARACAQLLQLPVVDGTFGHVEHSWVLVNRYGSYLDHSPILDVYAVGRLPMVQLVDGGALSGNAELFKKGSRRADIDFDLVQLLVLQMEPEMPGGAAP